MSTNPVLIFSPLVAIYHIPGQINQFPMWLSLTYLPNRYINFLPLVHRSGRYERPDREGQDGSFLNRDGYKYFAPVTLTAFYINPAIIRFNPVDHIRNTNACSLTTYVKALPVVFHNNVNKIIFFTYRNAYIFCFGIFQNIIGLLLDDPVYIQFKIVWKFIDYRIRKTCCYGGIVVKIIDYPLNQSF